MGNFEFASFLFKTVTPIRNGETATQCFFDTGREHFITDEGFEKMKNQKKSKVLAIIAIIGGFIGFILGVINIFIL